MAALAKIRRQKLDPLSVPAQINLLFTFWEHINSTKLSSRRGGLSKRSRK